MLGSTLFPRRHAALTLSLVTALAVLVCMTAAVPARADTIVTYSTSTPIPATTTDWGSSFVFPLFDPSLGTLQSVDIFLSSTLQTTLTVMNTGDTGSSGTAKTEVQVTVGGNPALDFFSPAYSYSLGAGGSASSGLLSSTSTNDSGPLNDGIEPGILEAFTGPGTVDLGASTFTQTDLSNTGGNTNAAQVTTDSLTGTVTYDYIATPEPASVVLLGIGAVGLFWVARRRRNG